MPNILETGCEWRAEDVSDETAWTEIFTPTEIAAFGIILLTRLPRGLAMVRIIRFAKPGVSAFQAAIASTCACSYSVTRWPQPESVTFLRKS